LRRHFNNFDALETQLPTFAPLSGRERIFVLAPHPDDECLGAGGLISRARKMGVEVQIGFLSNGDGSRTTQISQVLRGKDEKTLPDIALKRQDEALRAAQILGVDEKNVLFFGFPDGGARALWDGDYSASAPFVSPFTGYGSVEHERAFAPHSPYCRAALLENLALAFEAFEPTLVFTTHPRDTHLDHVVAYRACEAAIASLSSAVKPDLRAFLIHCGIWPVPNGLHPELSLAPPAHLLEAAPNGFHSRFLKKKSPLSVRRWSATQPNSARRRVICTLLCAATKFSGKLNKKSYALPFPIIDWVFHVQNLLQCRRHWRRSHRLQPHRIVSAASRR
jgi:LmbE family N-acetylglucosaminyl deacetylase